MPKVLEETAEDKAIDQMEADLEGEAAPARFSPNQQAPDLSDGGNINGVKLYPTKDGKRIAQGRANSRRAWMWNGSETTLPLGWNPDGTQHNGARPHLLKMHCICCGQSGFRTQTCPQCSRSGCTKCKSSTDQTEQKLPNGKVTKGWIIRAFYLSKDAVPFPSKFYGDVDCFLEFCPRRGEHGFKTQEDMRMHARSRHRMEYQAHMEAQAANKTDEVAQLREMVTSLMAGKVPQHQTKDEPETYIAKAKK